MVRNQYLPAFVKKGFLVSAACISLVFNCGCLTTQDNGGGKNYLFPERTSRLFNDFTDDIGIMANNLKDSIHEKTPLRIDDEFKGIRMPLYNSPDSRGISFGLEGNVRSGGNQHYGEKKRESGYFGIRFEGKFD